MALRTTSSTVSFAHPFRLAGMDEAWPPGLYEVEIDSEVLDDLSFPAQRRVATILYRRDPDSNRIEALHIDPADLDAALAADATRTPRTSATGGPGAGGAVGESLTGPTKSRPAGAANPGIGPVATDEDVADPRFTPLWVVPLLLAILVGLAAWFGPFVPS